MKEFLLKLKFNIVVQSPRFTRYTNGAMGITLDDTPNGWNIGADGASEFNQPWERVMEVIKSKTN